MISGGKVNQTEWNAQRFFERYGIHRYSRDTTPLPSSGQIIADYEKLPFPDRYAVFSQLQIENKTGLLDRIVDYPLRGPLNSKIDDLRAQLKKLMKEGGEESLWKGRIALQKTLYFMERWVDGIQKQFVGGAIGLFDIYDLDSIKNHIYSGFWELYWEYLVDSNNPQAGNPLFDSDGDLNPWRKETWDLAFDHRDIDPLDKYVLGDSDGDGVGNGIDVFEDDGAKWNKIPVGGKITSDYGDFVNPIVISRLSENEYAIDIKVMLKADPKGDTDAVTSKYLQPEFLANLGKNMIRDFLCFVQNGNEKFTVNIQLNGTKNEAESYDAMVTDRNIRRSNARMWGSDILEATDSKALWHEVFHLFGGGDFPDYYHENLADGNMRDCTFIPGREILSENHIMNNGTNILLRDLRKIVHKAEIENSIHDMAVPISAPEPQGKLLIKKGDYEQALQLGRAMQKDFLLKNPVGADEDALELIVTSLLLMGRRSEAEEQLREIAGHINYWQNKSKVFDELSPREIDAWFSWSLLDDMGLLNNVCQNLVEAKQDELAKEIYWKYPIADQNSLYSHSEYLELLDKIPGSEKETIAWWKEKYFPLLVKINLDPQHVSAHIAWLEERGYYDLTLEYYQFCLSKDPTNLDWRMGFAVALLRSGHARKGSEAIEEIKRIYAFLNERDLLEGLTWGEVDKRLGAKIEQAHMASPVMK